MDSLLGIQRQADPQEKIYVHFDKTSYNPGETIWFKAYLFTGIEPSEASKNFYAELVDEKNHVLSQKTAPVFKSGAAGTFDIDTAFKGEMVYFRAYTTTILNGDTSFIFSRAIRILTGKGVASKPAAPLPGTISFLPEGGECIAGLPCTMAFIGTNGKGLPFYVSGTVSDNAGNKISDFSTLQNGMGRFTFLPEEGKIYSALWKDETGKAHTSLLPAVKLQGVSLQLTEQQGTRRFTIRRTPQVPAGMNHLHLVGYMNQQLVFESAINLTDKLVAFGALPIQTLPSGILQITLFDSNYKPLAERIAFVNNHDYEFDADVFLSQKNLEKRGANGLEIKMTDTLPANLSLSITDADLDNSNPLSDNIISHLLLTGDLRGRIVNPYDYFFSTSDSASIYLDLVMLTHGWRRYNWDRVMAGQVAPARFKENNYLSLNGQLVGLLPGSINSTLQLNGILETTDSAKTFINLPVDRNGKVFTEGLIFYDKAKLFFNFNKKNLAFDKNMLMLDNGLRKGLQSAVPDTSAKLELPDIDASTLAGNAKQNKVALRALQQRNAATGMLENITIKARSKTAKEKMEEKYVSGLFSGDATTFDLVNDRLAGSYMNIFQYLQGRVAGLQITNGAGDPTLSWRGGTPVLYLNEMQADASMISGTSVSDVAYIKVFRPGASIVSGGGGGVISIYTRKGGDYNENSTTKGLTSLQLMGYSPTKEFYSPDYATITDKATTDDVRTTLYWDPFIFLDKKRQRLHFQFYNNDVTKRFRIILEGINDEGKLLHIEKIITK